VSCKKVRPACVNRMNMPLLCISIQPRSMACLSPAEYWAGVPFDLEQERPVDQLNMDAAILHGFDDALVISTSLRAAVAGSDSGLVST
jgi:hypothetical protein